MATRRPNSSCGLNLISVRFWNGREIPVTWRSSSTGVIWQRPWPAWKLVLATETTQLIGTLAAVYGWSVTPIGWTYALAVWAYALIWFFINSSVKINVYRLLRR